ncbi:MAG: HlyC/CorC family transporter [Anaerolineales bacterium]|nr:HlyC/CorC family transporter [Anaerolineales bacterium]
MVLDFVLIGLLIAMNGVFAMAELAIVAVRQTRLRTLADRGETRAVQLLKLRERPADFLATVQIGITLVATTASAIGGAEAIQYISPIIARNMFLAPYAEGISLGLVVIVVSYLSVVFGELIPKRIALKYTEKIALHLIRPIQMLSRLVHLPMRFLSLSSSIVLRLFGYKLPQEPVISSEEIEMIIKHGVAQGVILPIEEILINRVFVYADQAVRDVMTPRTEVIGFDKLISLSEALGEAKRFGYSRFPVYDKQIDDVLGYVHVKDLIWGLDKNINLEKCLRETIFVTENATLPEAFSVLTTGGKHLAIVIDEHGGVEGILTLEDLLEVVFGEIEDEHSPVAHLPEKTSKGEWIIAGSTLLPDVSNLLEITFQPKVRYKTIAGFIMTELGRNPEVGDQLRKFGYTFTVQSKDHLRITNVHITLDQYHSGE